VGCTGPGSALPALRATPLAPACEPTGALRRCLRSGPAWRASASRASAKHSASWACRWAPRWRRACRRAPRLPPPAAQPARRDAARAGACARGLQAPLLPAAQACHRGPRACMRRWAVRGLRGACSVHEGARCSSSTLSLVKARAPVWTHYGRVGWVRARACGVRAAGACGPIQCATGPAYHITAPDLPDRATPC